MKKTYQESLQSLSAILLVSSVLVSIVAGFFLISDFIEMQEIKRFSLVSKKKTSTPQMSDMRCTLLNMSGWSPVYDHNRNDVAALIGQGKAEMILADSITCVERNVYLPAKEEHRRMEWWRMLPKQSRKSVIKH